MTSANKRKPGSVSERQRLLVEANVLWLRQAEEVLDQISDNTYVASPPVLAPHRVGGHMRHILEFYECFLDGLSSSHVDYDARKRDVTVETSRRAALTRIGAIIDALQSKPVLCSDSVIWVRMEDSVQLRVEESFMVSSIGRELQTLSSHTIHHFALIAMTLRLLGYEVDRDFGVAPSTLRHMTSQTGRQIPAEAA